MPPLFKAHSVCELAQCDKSKIESLHLYSNRLLVGLNTGALRVYRVDETSSPSRAPGSMDASSSPKEGETLELLREEEAFGKKPIQQLSTVKEANLLVSLSDACVSLHDLQDYRLVERLGGTKGAACFAVTSSVANDARSQVSTFVSRLAVAVKHKVLCWGWEDMESVRDVLEIDLDASIKNLTWVDGTRLIAGMDAGFSVIDITTREIRSIHKPVANTERDAKVTESVGSRFGAVRGRGMGYVGMSGWVPKPMATRLVGDQVLLAKDVNSLFVRTDGEALGKRQVPWAFAPKAIGYSYPYLLALQSPGEGVVQVWNPETLSLLQTLSVPGATLVHVPQSNASLAHTGKGFLVASDRVIWRMEALPYRAQIASIVGELMFDEAISLLGLLEDTLIDDKAGRVREILTEKGISLFHQQRYRPALDLFTEAEVAPELVIALYRSTISGESFGDLEQPSRAKPALTNDAHSRGEDPVGASPHDIVDTDVRTKHDKTRSDLLAGETSKSAIRCLFSFLAQARKQVQKYLKPDGLLKVDLPTHDSEPRIPAFSNLLLRSRVERLDNIDWQAELVRAARLVDTTLFHAYMLVEPSLVGPLLRIPNFCDPGTVQSALRDHERYDDLIDFLYSRGLHRQALETLSKFGQDKMRGQAPVGMCGPEKTVSYLKRLSPDLLDIVFEFVQWPIQEHSEVGMKVFLDNIEGLPCEKVVEFLERFDRKLQIQYLEHIINELDEENTGFTQRLINLYIQELELEDSVVERREKLRSRLVSFLSQSKGFYDKSQTLSKLPPDEPKFHEARATVLGHMGMHKEALWVYVYLMRDYEKARAYCYRPHLEGTDKSNELLSGIASYKEHIHQLQPDFTDRPSVFTTLLSLYLDPPTGEVQHWPQALELLDNHGARLPVEEVLEVLPNALALKELQGYFCGRMRDATSVSRQEAIVVGLEGIRRTRTERVLSFGSRDELGGQLRGRHRRVKIGGNDHCKICHKRFGSSAIRLYPDNEVLHYGCQGRSRS